MRDHMDILLSLEVLPVVVISDLASMLARHGENRLPGIFKPFCGRLAEPTEANISAAKDGNLVVHIPGLDPNVVPEEGVRYSLADKFHQGNLSANEDFLRRVSLVPQLAGRVNTQVQEQLFRKFGRDAYFLTQLTPAHLLSRFP